MRLCCFGVRTEMKCYLINLDRSTDRLKWFAGNAESLGVDLVRVAAIEGKTIPSAEKQQILKASSGRYAMGPGEIGCFLSHRAAWQAVSAGPDLWAFVAEDDVHFSTSAKALFDSSDWFPPDADIVKAETHGQKTDVSVATGGHVERYQLRLLRSVHGGSGGYFVSKKAAGLLFELSQNRCEPADELLFNPNLGVADRLKIYQLDPAPCIQDFLLSDQAVGFESLLELDRAENADIDPARQKYHGLQKVKREGWRVLRIIRRFILRLTGISVFKVIPFDSGPGN